MEIQVKSNSNFPSGSSISLPPGEIRLDSQTTASFQIEIKNAQSRIVDRQSFNLDLPDFWVDGQAVSARDYIRAQMLRSLGFEEIANSDNPQNYLAPNWLGLVSTMRGSLPFIKLFSVALDFNQKGAMANAIFTLLLTTLTSTNNMDDLLFTVSSLPSIMEGIYNQEDIIFINNALANNGFSFQLPL